MSFPTPSPRLFIDDLPSAGVSRLVAELKITRDATRAVIHLDGVRSEFSVRALIFPTAAGGRLSSVIAASGFGRFGCTTTLFAVGIVSSVLGLCIVVVVGTRVLG